MTDGSAFACAVRRVLADLSPGEVVTYSEVAAQAGFPRAARAVGNLLAASDGLPWWRVVASNGRLAPGHEAAQEARLRAEGVMVHDGRVVVGSRHRRGRSLQSPG